MISRQGINRKFFLFIFLLLLFSVPAYGANFTIPSSRTIDWSLSGATEWYPTTRTTQCGATHVPGDCSGGTCSDDIQSWLNACPDGQYVKLGPGTFPVNATINWPKSNVTLRGSGMTGANKTILQVGSGLSGKDLFYFNGDYGWSGTARSISSGNTKGSTQIVTSAAHGWVAGDYVLIDQTNESGWTASGGVYGTCDWCDAFGGTRLKAQVAKITSVPNSTTANFTPPLFDNFSSSNSPRGKKNTDYIKNISIEDMVINDPSRYCYKKISTMALFNSVIYRVEINGLSPSDASKAISLNNASFNTFRQMYVHNASTGATNSSYPFWFTYNSCNNLVENSVFSKAPEGVVSEGAGSGNVFAYNYYVDMTYHINNLAGYPNFAVADHGAGTWYTLYEGNVISQSKWRSDSGFGSQHNKTLFRNSIVQWTTGGLTDGIDAIDMEQYNYWSNIVGNVIGSAGFETVFECEYTVNNCDASTKSIYRIGYRDAYDNSLGHDTLTRSRLLRHANYDYVNKKQLWCNDALEPGCQGATATDHTLPNSLYLSGKPAWFGTLTWPPIDPSGPSVSDIPAKIFYNTGSWPTQGGVDTTPPSPPTNLRIF